MSENSESSESNESGESSESTVRAFEMKQGFLTCSGHQPPIHPKQVQGMRH